MKSTILYIRKHPLLLCVLIPAFIAHMLVMFPSGSSYCVGDRCGLAFWGAHGHDAIWHFAVSNVSFKSIPFIMPTLSGVPLGSYNYLLDIWLSLVSLAGIPAIISYFKIFPVVWFVLLSWTAISFARKVHDSPLFVGLLLFFLYFGGSFSYLLTFYHHGTLWGSSGLLAMQAGLSLVNLQFALSLVVLLAILNVIMDNHKAQQSNTIVLSLLVSGALALKFYAGVLSMVLVGLHFLFIFLRQKHIRQTLQSYGILAATILITLIAFYNLFVSAGGSGLVWSPFSIVHPIIEEKELFYLKDTVNARYFLQEAVKETGKPSPRLVWIEFLTLSIFIIFNFGTRVISIVYLLIQGARRKLTLLDAYLGITTVAAILLTILFIQKGVWWNTIQFLYYALFFMSIFSAITLYRLIRWNKAVGLIIAAVVVLLTIPTSLDVLKGFTQFPAPAYLPEAEQEALAYLRQQPNGIVYAPVYKKSHAGKPPYALAFYDDTSYISAFSHKQTYAADEVQLMLLNLDYKSRYEQLQKDPCVVPAGVTYVYYRSDTRLCPFDTVSGLRRIFRNNLVSIYTPSQSINN